MEIFSIIILALSGLLLVFVGAMRLSNPIQTYAKNSGIKLDQDVDLLNEIRGVSALQLCAGLIAWTGIFFPPFRTTSFAVAALVFVGFLMGRLISISADGKPNKQIMQGIIFELVLGAANIFGLISSLS
ncbi:MAG: DUF4345 domain-containing protein [Bacteroidia bacterium]|nr:DUF4345 domain-containing protein [Bacteroidia bacterium]